jgi:hypothetical protein
MLRSLTAKDIASGNWDNPNQEATTQTDNSFQQPRKTSIVVCRSHQCAPAKLSMSKEYIFNSLLHLFDNNNYQKILVCQADADAHTCLENFITIPLTVGITPTNAYIDQIKITDVIIGKKAQKINLILNYNLTFGGQTPDCTPSQSILFAKAINHVIIEDAGYNCKMTTIGQSTIKTLFSIDYIDLDYGYIGGHYSVGVSGPAYGGGSGYMLLRLPKNAYPLAPQLKAPKTPLNIGGPKGTTLNVSGTSSTSNSDSEITTSGSVQVFPINK